MHVSDNALLYYHNARLGTKPRRISGSVRWRRRVSDQRLCLAWCLVLDLSRFSKGRLFSAGRHKKDLLASTRRSSLRAGIWLAPTVRKEICDTQALFSNLMTTGKRKRVMTVEDHPIFRG